MDSGKSWKKRAQKLRVPVGTALGLVFLLFMHPSIRSLWIGILIAMMGSFFRLWAAGHIEKGRALVQGGPYAYTRNPLYLGSFVMALGIILAGQGYWLLIPFGVFFIFFYLPVMHAEEQDLFDAYGDRFLEYTKRVPMFFPGSRTASYASSSFLWSRVIRNREHRTLISFFIVIAILILRLLYGK